MTASTAPIQKSIFHEYFHQPPFVDRFLNDPEGAIDVIIPMIHSNELWESNLKSIYREIPVHALLIGDGGCIDNSLEVLKQFPRVTVFDHRSFVSLGFSIRKLVEAVQTEWFTYLHSDVYLPAGWFDAMRKHQGEFDWFECRQQMTVLVDYPHDYTNYTRPLSGSQMGRKAVFQSILPKIDDDYLYRNEDQIMVEMLRAHGVRYGRADDVHHFHQLMQKKSAWKRSVSRVALTVEKSPEEREREAVTHVRSIIKYTQPNSEMIVSLRDGLIALQTIPTFVPSELRAWTAQTNPVWLPYLQPERTRLLRRLYRAFSAFLRTLRQP